jgi:hypothetical protein
MQLQQVGGKIRGGAGSQAALTPSQGQHGVENENDENDDHDDDTSADVDGDDKTNRSARGSPYPTTDRHAPRRNSQQQAVLVLSSQKIRDGHRPRGSPRPVRAVRGSRIFEPHNAAPDLLRAPSSPTSEAGEVFERGSSVPRRTGSIFSGRRLRRGKIGRRPSRAREAVRRAHGPHMAGIFGVPESRVQVRLFVNENENATAYQRDVDRKLSREHAQRQDIIRGWREVGDATDRPTWDTWPTATRPSPGAGTR